MKPQRNPNAWSCLPTAFAIALDIPVEQLIDYVGHDGSEVTHAGLPVPLRYRGFHPQELIKICLGLGLSATRVELIPSAIPSNYHQDAENKLFNTGGWDWFLKNLFNTKGTIECRTASGLGHTLAYEGKQTYAEIFDPATNDTFEFHTPEDAERRDRFLVALWRFDRIQL